MLKLGILVEFGTLIKSEIAKLKQFLLQDIKGEIKKPKLALLQDIK